MGSEEMPRYGATANGDGSTHERDYLHRIEEALELALESELEHVHDLEVTILGKQRYLKLLAAVRPLVAHYLASGEKANEIICVPRGLLENLLRTTAEITER